MADVNRVLRVEKGHAEIVEKPFPNVREGFVLVRIEIAPICTEQKVYSTGFLEWYERHDCLGHEGVGVIERIGPGVSEHKEGDRVIIYQGWPCGHCWVCAHGLGPTHCQHFRGFEEIEAHNRSASGAGGFSQYRLAPTSMVQRIPDTLDWKYASSANCLIGCTYTAVRELDIGPEDVCLVAGIGFIGHATIVNLRHRNARVIALGRNAQRLKLARELGADLVLDPDADDWLEVLRAATPDGRGVDAAFEGSGYPYYQSRALAACRAYGTVVLLGYAAQEADMKWAIQTETELCWSHKHITASFDVAFNHRADLVELLQQPSIQAPIDRMVTHQVPMSRAADAFEAILAGEACKVHLLPQL